MAGRISASMERALARVANGDTPYAAAKAEGIPLPSIYRALTSALSNWPGFAAAKAKGMELAAIYRASLAGGSLRPEGVSTSSRTMSDQTPRRPKHDWDPAVLKSVETELAGVVVDPIARFMVHQAARTCTDLPTLLDLLIDSLVNLDQRRAFISKARSAGLIRHEGEDEGEVQDEGIKARR